MKSTSIKEAIPACLMQVGNLFKRWFIVIILFILVLLIFLGYFQDFFSLRVYNSEAFSQEEQIFLNPKLSEEKIIELSNFTLINENSIQATFPLTVVTTTRALGGIIDDIDYYIEPETRETIIEYIVEEGDSLWSIADKFNISVDTIIWANEMRGTTIRYGQKLVILPISGILHIVKEKDTISEIAEKYNIEKEKILDFNNISDEESLFIGQSIVVPGGIKQNLRPVTRIANLDITNLTPNQVRTKFSTNNYWGQSHAFPFGQCTWWVAQKRPIGRWGHAKSWLNNAQRDGFEVCRGNHCQPQNGAIIVVKGDPIFGHVAYVEEVRGNSIIFSEMNNIGWGKVNRRTIQIGDSIIIGFIYPVK